MSVSKLTVQQLEEIRSMFRWYRQLTGRSLTSIVGDLGELLVAKTLGLTAADVNCKDYDATDSKFRYQIKTRIGRGRFGKFKEPLGGFDYALFAKMEDLRLTEIWEADRETVATMIRAQNGRSDINDSLCRRHAKLIWEGKL